MLSILEVMGHNDHQIDKSSRNFWRGLRLQKNGTGVNVSSGTVITYGANKINVNNAGRPSIEYLGTK